MTAFVLVCLCALIAAPSPPALAQPAPAPAPSAFLQNEWSLAGFGNTTGPVGKPAYIAQRANILVAAGEAAQGVVNGSATRNSSLPNSFAVTSPSNAAQLGQTDSRGLLVYQPATTVIDATDFQTFFDASYSNSSVKGIALAPGTYTINNNQPSFHINLYCFNRQAGLPFELDFNSTTIFFGNYQNGGIGFFFCQDFYFHGPFNFMYATAALPFSQGTITGLVNNGDGSAQYTVGTDEGYPTTTTGLGDGKAHLNIAYDSLGRIVLNTSDIYSEVATQNIDGTYTFRANLPPNIAVGTRLAIRGNAGNHGIFMYKCVNFRVSFVYMYTSPIFGFLDTFGTNVTISNNVIQPWPFPIGTTRPLLSTNADGIHSAGGRGASGPKIISNQIINPGDDGIAIHGNYYTVYAVDSANSGLIIFSPNCGNDFCAQFQTGDTVAVYSAPYENTGGSLAVSQTAFTNLGTATINTVTRLNDDPNIHPGFPFVGDTGASIYPLVNYNIGFYYRVTFATLPSGFSQATRDGLIADLSANGDNFNVASNFITNHRARSIHVKSNNGAITNNVVQNPNIYGLLLAPDLYFLEGDFMSNVTISNNYVNATFADLFHMTLNPVDFTVVPTQNSQNLLFISNVFDNAGTWSVAVSSVNGLTYQGNIVRNAGCYPSVFGNFLPFIPARTLVYLAQIGNAVLRGNFFTTTQNCQAKYGNYAAPYYADDVAFGTG